MIVILNVNGVDKKSTELSYEDLCWLYQDFTNKYGHVPITSECLSKYNLPQARIVNKILDSAGITYNDFINQFGKTSHVRANKNNYDKYVDRFKEVSNQLGRALKFSELVNNEYGLPSSGWLVKNCPDDSVKSYDDFVVWCGFDSNSLKMDKQYVIDSVYKLQEELGRPIIREDLTLDKIGFSSIVINRIWGGLNNCKDELGLLRTESSKSLPFSHYKEILDGILDDITENNDRDFISWNDIENNNLGIIADHKTLTKSFNDNGVDIFAYIKSRNLNMNPSSVGNKFTFDDGERVLSTYEFDYSIFLRDDLGLKYKDDYMRDVMYKTFLEYDKRKKTNCDYVVNYNGGVYYIEIAGMISCCNGNWENTDFKDKREREYKEKMILKKKLLIDNNKKFLFLFPEDFRNGIYKEKTYELLRIKGRR